MEKVLVIVFNDKSTAYEGLLALEQLDGDGEISIHEIGLIAKDGAGKVHIERDGNPVVGTVVWSLFGLLGGPVRAGSLAAGGLFGSVTDLEEAGISKQFAEEISIALDPGRVALIADVMEERVTPIDACMETLGGVVFRRTRDRIESTEEDRDVDAYSIQLEQLKVERADAGETQHRDWLDAKIRGLNLKLENAIDRRRVKTEIRERELEQKVGALRQRAAHAKGEFKDRQTNRIAELLDNKHRQKPPDWDNPAKAKIFYSVFH